MSESGQIMVVHDLLGHEIKIGSYICYAVRVGNSSEMRIGYVYDIKDEVLFIYGCHPEQGWRYSSQIYKSRLSCYDRIVVIHESVVKNSKFSRLWLHANNFDDPEE